MMAKGRIKIAKIATGHLATASRESIMLEINLTIWNLCLLVGVEILST